MPQRVSANLSILCASAVNALPTRDPAQLTPGSARRHPNSCPRLVGDFHAVVIRWMYGEIAPGPDHLPVNRTRNPGKEAAAGPEDMGRLSSSICVGRIFGIPLNINYSWLIIFILVIFLMSSQFAELYPFWPAAARWVIAIVTTCLFFLSVLAHELSHSLVALARGIPVRSITLFIFGGVSQLAEEAQRPISEFLVTIVGAGHQPTPGAGCGNSLVHSWDLFLLPGGGAIHHFRHQPVAGHVFNMLPGYPLDGGRVLRALIWSATGNYWLATRIAIRAGQGLGGLMIAGGVIWAVTGNFQGLWISLVGGFLVYVATSNYQQEALRAKLGSRRVLEAMKTGQEILPGDLPALSSASLVALARSGYLGIIVEGPTCGIVTGQFFAQSDPGMLQPFSLSHLMKPLASFPALEAESGAMDALERMEEENFALAVVVRNHSPIGLISRSDLLELIQTAKPR